MPMVIWWCKISASLHAGHQSALGHYTANHSRFRTEPFLVELEPDRAWLGPRLVVLATDRLEHWVDKLGKVAVDLECA
jgi:hypothetical protein